MAVGAATLSSTWNPTEKQHSSVPRAHVQVQRECRGYRTQAPFPLHACFLTRAEEYRRTSERRGYLIFHWLLPKLYLRNIPLRSGLQAGRYGRAGGVHKRPRRNADFEGLRLFASSRCNTLPQSKVSGMKSA